jgi:4-amino-4-deoxy-L-arabinose transferase-like glycosyltransferase
LFFILLALAWTLFGQSLVVTHAIVVLFSFLGVLFTYLLGRDLVNHRVGFLASLLLLFSPLYFAQSGILNFEIPLTALSVMAIYFALRENPFGYGLAALSLVLTKETGMLILIPLALVMGLRDRPKRKFYATFAMVASPLAVYVLWLAACRMYLGWYVFPAHAGILNLSSPFHLVKVLIDRLSQILIEHHHWILSLTLVLGAWAARKDLDREKLKILLLGGGLAAYVIFFSFYSVPLDRYLLPVYPLFFLLCSWSMDRLSRTDWKPSAVALLVILSLFIMSWKGRRSAMGFELETNLEYLDFIDVHKKAARFIEENFSDKHILTDWPQTMELRHPLEGYVTKPLRASSIFEPYDLAEVDIVYYVPQSVKEFGDLIGQLELVPLAKYEKNGKEAVVSKLLRSSGRGGQGEAGTTPTRVRPSGTRTVGDLE